MGRAVLFLCVVGAAGLWGWALFASKTAELEPLPARFAGTYRFFMFEPPPGVPMENPLPHGFSHLFTFREDGTYLLSVLVSGGYEIVRDEGVVAADAAGVLTLTRISRNRKESRGTGERFKTERGEDQEGQFLALRHASEGYTFRLRPQKAE
jgi:hypothetical protein